MKRVSKVDPDRITWEPLDIDWKPLDVDWSPLDIDWSPLQGDGKSDRNGHPKKGVSFVKNN